MKNLRPHAGVGKLKRALQQPEIDFHFSAA
jgi:hypothetical protein